MRTSPGNTRLKVGLTLALLGISVGLLPIGSTAVGYELSPAQGYAVLTLAAVLFAASPVALFWHWFRRWRPFTLAPVDETGSGDAQGRSASGNNTSGLTETAAELAAAAGDQLAEDDTEGFKRSVIALGLEVMLQERLFWIGQAGMDKGRLVIVVEDEGGILQLRDKLTVVDTEDLYFMGTFEVTQKRAGGCHAVEGRDVDGLWKGAVRNGEEGVSVTSKAAILKEQRDER